MMFHQYMRETSPNRVFAAHPCPLCDHPEIGRAALSAES